MELIGSSVEMSEMSRGARLGMKDVYRTAPFSTHPANRLLFSCILLLIFLLFTTASFAQGMSDSLTPPPAPDVKPLIGTTYLSDENRDHIDDALLAHQQAVEQAIASATTAEKRSKAQAELDTMVDVELVFTSPVTQKQIGDFQAMGGQITYIYKAVSYGWNGRLPLRAIDRVPGAMGATLVLVSEPKIAKLHLQTATQGGRVRPIWANDFAQNPSGFHGDSTITIAILDTGVDESHTDLNGRRVYWHDFTTDSEASPMDILQHGSHVAGIATGTGAASGSATGTLYYTDSGSMSGLTSGSFFPAPVWIPSGSVTLSSTAKWLGGGQGNLYGVYAALGTTSYYALSAATTGPSPVSESNSFTVNPANCYMAALLSNGLMSTYAVSSSITNYPAVGDGSNRMSGVAPGCSWAGAKVFTNAGSGSDTIIGSAVDTLVSNRVALNIKVMNLSIGTIGDPGLDPTLRQKINTAVNNGIVMCCSAGNDGDVTTSPQPGSRQIDDPGRAALAITVGATNAINELTDYTSWGFSSPSSTSGQEEDYKPDVLAPGGSFHYSMILSVDSNSADGENASFADMTANDYYPISGTSMASPFVAGCSALIIDALQQSGTTWDFNSSQHARLVKMLLCATSSETNANREVASGADPELQRAATGANGYPAGKDIYEGYGIINPDAAVEAISETYTLGTVATDTLGGDDFSKRVWARTVNLSTGTAFEPTLTNPPGGDFDLYLYSATPSSYGTPTILASGTNAGNGVSDTFTYTPGSPATAYLVVKKVSGSGTFSLSTTADVTPPNAPNVTGTTPTNDTTPTWTWTSGGGDGNGNYRYQLNSEAGSWTTTTAMSYTPAAPLSEATHTLYVQERDDAGNWSLSGSFAITIDVTAPNVPNVTGSTPTNDTTPTWTWTSGGGGNGNYRYQLDTEAGSWTATTGTSFTPGAPLSEGSHTLYVQERDNVGNWSVSGTFTITIDVTGPNAPNVTGGTPTNDNTPTWTWASGGGGNGNYRYQLNSEAGSWTTTTASSYTPGAPLSEAAHTLYVQERDNVGNWSVSGAFAITIDVTAPNVPNVTGSTPTIGTTPTWTWTSGGGGNGNYRYQLNSEAGTWTTTTAASYTPATPLTEATHTLYVQERDNAGNWSFSGSFAITIDTTPPTVALSSPSVSITATGPVTFTVSYANADSVNLTADDVTLNRSGTADATVGVSGVGNASRTVTLSSITGNGTLGISIAANTASDAAGNNAASTGLSATVNVDNTTIAINIGAPSTTLTRNGPVEYAITYENVSAVTLGTGDIALNTSGTATATVQVSSAKFESTVIRTVTLTSITGDGVLGFDILPGTATDDLNNSAPGAGPSGTFTVDNTSPVITILGNNPVQVLEGEPYIDPGAIASDSADGDISSQIVIDASNVNTHVVGTYTVIYTVTDTAGNAAAQLTRTVEVVASSVPVPLTVWPLAVLLFLAGTAFTRANGRKKPDEL